MSHKETKYVGSFYAESDDGQFGCQLHRFVEIHVSGPRRIEGHTLVRTDDGELVNREDKGKYRHVTLGLDLFSDDPNAP